MPPAARVKFRAPSALAEYRLAALGVTGSDTLVGQTTSGISVRKAFFVELKAPSVLTEGDEPQLLARLHHPGINGQARVALKVDMGGREEVFPKTADLAAGGVTEVLLDAFRVPGADRVKLTVSASASAAPAVDEVVAEVPVRAWGLPVFATASGQSSDDATVFVALPQGRRYENPEMRIALSPRPTGCSSSWRWMSPERASASVPNWPACRPGRRSSRRRPAGRGGGDVGASRRAGTRVGRRRAADRADLGAGHRAGQRPEPGRELALGPRGRGAGGRTVATWRPRRGSSGHSLPPSRSASAPSRPSWTVRPRTSSRRCRGSLRAIGPCAPRCCTPWPCGTRRDSSR